MYELVRAWFVAKGLAQPHHVGLQGAAGAGGRVVAPDPVGQLLQRHHLVGPQQQGGQQRPVFSGSYLDRQPASADLDRPENPENHLLGR